MVRSSTYRKSKYESKIVPAEVAKSVEAQLPGMVEQASAKFADLSAVENAVKAIVESAGVSVVLIPFYLDVGREFYKLFNKFTGTTLKTEFEVAQAKWVARTLDNAQIIDIAALFGITLT